MRINKKNCLQAALWIEQSKEFDMAVYGLKKEMLRPPCNTVACLKGTIAIKLKVAKWPVNASVTHRDIYVTEEGDKVIEKFLGVSEDDMSVLFVPHGWSDTNRSIWQRKADQIAAAGVLRRMAVTGELPDHNWLMEARGQPPWVE